MFTQIYVLAENLESSYAQHEYTGWVSLTGLGSNQHAKLSFGDLDKTRCLEIVNTTKTKKRAHRHFALAYGRGGGPTRPSMQDDLTMYGWKGAS
jgi:hypothetical protein